MKLSTLQKRVDRLRQRGVLPVPPRYMLRKNGRLRKPHRAIADLFLCPSCRAHLWLLEYGWTCSECFDCPIIHESEMLRRVNERLKERPIVRRRTEQCQIWRAELYQLWARVRPDLV